MLKKILATLVVLVFVTGCATTGNNVSGYNGGIDTRSAFLTLDGLPKALQELEQGDTLVIVEYPKYPVKDGAQEYKFVVDVPSYTDEHYKTPVIMVRSPKNTKQFVRPQVLERHLTVGGDLYIIKKSKG